jgi:hypothetical protein
MKNYEQRQELERELRTYKVAYRRNHLPQETAKFIAREIYALEQLIKETRQN